MSAPDEPPPPEDPSLLGGVSPDELFARALQTVKMTTGGAGGWQPPTLAEAATLFPNYEVLRLLGRGGMGAVYQARQIELDRLVAIKLLPLEISVDQEFVDRFRREARAMARLHHPNIITVFDFGTTREGHLFFVMEYVEGANLQAVIRQSGLNAEQALSVLEQVCTALAYAHGKGIVHRDIKPANVMIDTESHVKVADFGLARLIDNAAPDLGHTTTGTVMGTPDYMAPEQMRGMNVDHRADIYSLGVMLYEMLCREVPKGVFQWPSERTGCDARLDAIVIKALQQAPDHRYQSTTEMKADVIAARTPLAVALAPHTTLPSGPTQEVHPRPMEKPALPEPKAAMMKAITPPAPAKKSKLPLYTGLAAALLGVALAAVFLLPRSQTPFGNDPAPATPSPADLPKQSLGTSESAPIHTFAGHTYQFVPGEVTWDEAKVKAETMGGHLATVTSQQEHDWIGSTFGAALSASNRVWLGASAAENAWEWVTKEPFQFQRWAKGEPNGLTSRGSPMPPPYGLALSQGKGATFFWVDSTVNTRAVAGFLTEWEEVKLEVATAQNTPASGTNDAPPAADTAAKASEVLSFAGHRYQFVPGSRRDWFHATAQAKAMGGHLVTITAKEEAAWICSTFRSHFTSAAGLSRTWIGAVAESGSEPWQWVTSEPFSFSDWEQGEPQNGYRDDPRANYAAGINSKTLQWIAKTKADTTSAGFIVEWDADGKPEPAPTAPATPAPSNALPAATPRTKPATPALTTPVPAAVATPVPKALNETEKWLAQIDALQQAAWQKDVVKPYEASVAALRAKHRAALDDAFTKATKAGDRKQSVIWRDERQAFEAKYNVVAQDEPGALSALRTLRASFRQQLASLDANRAMRAKALHAQYDFTLAQNQTALVQNKRIPEAQLIEARRAEIAKAWLGADMSAHPAAAALIPPSAAHLPPAATPAPVADNSFLLASKDRPLVNGLGMKFVPVPISGGPTDKKRVLFSIWETRVRDYEVFARETGTVWPPQTLPQEPTQPAGQVSWLDTQAFCQWLTERERQAGRLRPGERYRLPTDHEWTCAVASKEREDPKDTPLTKSGKIRESYPWGTAWPPPRGAGNYCGEECLGAGAPGGPHLKDYRDNFAATAPVGSFLANKHGLYDLGGNVWEWCEDLIAPDRIGERVSRGASYLTFERGPMWWSARAERREIWREPSVGFRVVLSATP